MASLINVTNVQVLDNPTKFTNPFQFEITFECLEPGIKEELEWKLIYVGSAEDEQYDQELDSVLVGPVSLGKNKFVFQAPPPDLTHIPEKDLLEVTVILLTCSYKDKEFIRIGYYVNNDYGGEPIPDTILTRYTRQQQVSEEQSTEADAEEEAEMAAADDEKEGEEGEEEEGDDDMDGEETDEKSNKTQQTQGSPSAAITTASLQNMSAPQFTFGSPSPSTSTSTSTSSSPSTTSSSAPDIDLNKLHRNILADKPRVTRFQIPWDQEEPAPTAVVAPSEISLQSESDLFSSGRAPNATSSMEKQHLSLPNGVPYEENSIDMVDE